jgi:hypothetical protein
LVENKNNYVITDEVFYNVEHYFYELIWK